MSCRWKEEQAHSFAEGGMEPQTRHSFAGHLVECASCRERVTEANRLHDLLSAAITPVPAPPSLLSRIEGAVAQERGRRRGLPFPLLFRRRSFSLAAAGLVVIVGLALASLLVAPGAVMAVVQRALVFIPGLGINSVDEGSLVSSGPVAVNQGKVTFMVEALLSDGKQTRIKFSVAGLPGGKEGWEAAGNPRRQPRLRDEAGREYPMTMGHHGTGGTAEATGIEGTMYFPGLPGKLRGVELIVPMDWLVPETVVPGSGESQWVTHIPLSPPAQSGLPSAAQQGGTATTRGVTLRVAASSVEPDRTVLLLEGMVSGQGKIAFVGKNGGNMADEVIMRDDKGRSYPVAPQGSRGGFGNQPFRENLYFGPLMPGAKQLTLSVKSLQVNEEGAAALSLPVAGRKPGETFALGRSIDLGGHPVLLKSARISEERDGLWLYVDVDLGPTEDGRTLSSFSVDDRGRHMASMGARSGEQMDMFGVPLEPAEKEVELRLSRPLVNVEGPWEIGIQPGGN